MGVAGGEAGTWSGRCVLVTGAAGLLGGWVSRRLLDEGATVLGLDIAWNEPRAVLLPKAIERVDGDVRDAELVRGLLAERKVDTVVHLAAQTLVGPAIADPVDTFSNNIEGSWTILEACRNSKSVKRVVVASSDKAYGDWSGKPYHEEMALRARHPYDFSKAATDLMAQSYAETYDLPVAITRCGNLYGGGDVNWSRIVPGTIRSVLEREAPVIRSDGTFIRDYLHVSDAAQAVLLLAEAVGRKPELHGQPFNFAAGTRLSVLEVVRLILDLMRSDLQPRVLGLPLQEIPAQRLSATLARETLSWRPRMTIEAGLTEAIDWYTAHLAEVA